MGLLGRVFFGEAGLLETQDYWGGEIHSTTSQQFLNCFLLQHSPQELLKST